MTDRRQEPPQPGQQQQEPPDAGAEADQPHAAALHDETRVEEQAFAQAVLNDLMPSPQSAALARYHNESDGDSQAWLLTYTDLVTLLLVLFVALLLVANLDPVTPPRDVSHEGMSRPRTPAPIADIGVDGLDQGVAVVSSGGARETPLGEGVETLRRLRLYVREAGLRGDVDILVADGIVQLAIRTPVTFQDKRAELNLQGREMLLKLAPILARIDGVFTVMGGANDVLGSSDNSGAGEGRGLGHESDGWALASERAVAVARMLISAGVSAEALTVAAKPILQVSARMSQTLPPEQADGGVPGVVISIHQQNDGPEDVLFAPQ